VLLGNPTPEGNCDFEMYYYEGLLLCKSPTHSKPHVDSII